MDQQERESSQPWMTSVGAAFDATRVPGFEGIERASEALSQAARQMHINSDDFHIAPDPAPGETAKNTRQIAGHLQSQSEYVQQLVQLTEANLKISEQQRKAAKEWENFARRTTWATLVIAAFSLLTSATALIITATS